jgi:hypothetical protein
VLDETDAGQAEEAAQLVGGQVFDGAGRGRGAGRGKEAFSIYYGWVALWYKESAMTKKNDKVPPFEELMNPLLKALKDLGGSGSIDEIYERVTENLSI